MPARPSTTRSIRSPTRRRASDTPPVSSTIQRQAAEPDAREQREHGRALGRAGRRGRREHRRPRRDRQRVRRRRAERDDERPLGRGQLVAGLAAETDPECAPERLDAQVDEHPGPDDAGHDADRFERQQPGRARRPGGCVQRVDHRDPGADRQPDGDAVAQGRPDCEQRHRAELGRDGGAEAEPDQQRGDHRADPSATAPAARPRRALNRTPPPTAPSASSASPTQAGQGASARAAAGAETRTRSGAGAEVAIACDEEGAGPSRENAASRGDAETTVGGVAATTMGGCDAREPPGPLRGTRVRGTGTGGGEVVRAPKEWDRVDVAEAVARAPDAEVQAGVAGDGHRACPRPRPRRCGLPRARMPTRPAGG